MFWGAAALHPSMRRLEEPVEGGTRLTKLRLLLLTVACLVAPAVGIWYARHTADSLVIVGASVVLFLLVVARMAGLVRKEERRTAHEHALRRAGVRLAATEGDGVYESVVAATREVLPDKEVQIRLLVCNGDEPTLVASNEPLPAASALDADASGWLHSTLMHASPLPAAAVPVSAQEVLGLGTARYVHFSRLTTRSETSGALVIATERPLPGDELELLDSLATHVSLSLESAALSAEATPTEERGALPLARGKRNRPDHRPRRRRRRHLPEPVDRARAGLLSGGDRGAPLRQPPRRGGSPALRPDLRRATRRAPRRLRWSARCATPTAACCSSRCA